MRRSAATLFFLVLGLGPALANDFCGLGPSDWCPAPAGDPCGRHKTASECKADKACYGMEYRGESVVACRFDERGFASNCPTVGCTSQKPGTKDKGKVEAPKQN